MTPITATPQDGPAPGKGYRIEYSGTDSLEVLVPYQTGEVPLLYVWSVPQISVYENRNLDASWLALEATDTVSTPAVFPLLDPGSQAAAFHKGGSPTKFVVRPYDIWQATITKSSGQWEKLGILTELAKNCILSIYDALPASVQPAAKAEIDGRLAPKVHYAYPGMISLYHPFVIGSGVLGSTFRTADPYFMFQTIGGNAASSSTVAHEVGHYMSHILVGDDNMAVLESQANKYHEMGDAHSGRPMLEEYAMFADYFMWGKTGGSNNMEEPINLLNLVKSSTPAQIDWPSREGYATCLLAVLHAGKPKLTVGLSGASEDIPVISASFTDEWGMLADKPMNVNALRGEVALYLNKSGKWDAMPILLERTGWSYHGSGTVVDDQNHGIASARVQMVAKLASGKEYYAPLQSVTTDKDGNFTFDRVFPGATSVRVWVGKDSMDLPISVDANQPTNIALSLGQFKFAALGDLFALTSFAQTASDGVIEAPWDVNLDFFTQMASHPTSDIFYLGYGGLINGGHEAQLSYKYGSADDFETIADQDPGANTTNVKNEWTFTGTASKGSLHGIKIYSGGTVDYPAGWYEVNADVNGQSVQGEVILHARHYVENSDYTYSLHSSGSITYSFAGTRK